MFYERDAIESKLICSICAKRIDVPRLLPCGYTVCDACASSLVKLTSNDDLFECQMCKQVHSKPTTTSGFPIQKLILELLQLKSRKVYRSGVYQQVDVALKQFEHDLRKLEYLVENGEYHVRSHCASVRDKVERHTEECVSELNAHRDKLLSEISSYEDECLTHCGLMTSRLDAVKDMIENYEKLLLQWSDYFKKADTCDIQVEKILAEVTVSSNNLLIDLTKFERELFRSSKLYFKESKCEQLTSDSIGKIEFKPL